MKNFLKATFIFMTSCSDDVDNHNDIIKKNSNSTISFDEFKSKTGLKDFKKTISIPSKSITAKNGEAYSIEDFIIDTDYIKQTLVDTKVAYSFNITPKLVTSKNVFNLIVYNLENDWEYSIIEMEPDTATLLALQNGAQDSFKCRLKEIYSSAARPIGTGCITIFVNTYHCTHTGECASGTCDLCSLCVSSDSYRLCGNYGDQEFQPAEIVQLPVQHNGGGGANNNPSIPAVPINPGDIVFQPNLHLQNSNLKVWAADFWNVLSEEQQAWASMHPNSYDSFLQYYLDSHNEATESMVYSMIWSMTNNDDYSGDGFTGDNDNDNTPYTGPKQLIPQSIITTDGTTVQVTFGTTSSDNQSSNKEVAVTLVNAIKTALSNANNNLPTGNKITSIYIAATTNGSHGGNSNHYKGTAVDISRINENKIINLGPNDQVSALQEGFENCDNIRENFGPAFKHKTETDGSVNDNFNVSGHKDHIHISVQNN